MDIVIYVFAGLFLLLALGLIFGYFRTRHPGLVLMASCYGTGAVLAVMLMHWWPLVAGFVLAWMLRMMGLDPGPADVTRK
jgi:uncharacterized membrane protein